MDRLSGFLEFHFFLEILKIYFVLQKKDNSWVLEHYQNCECIKELKLPFCSIGDLDVCDQKISY